MKILTALIFFTLCADTIVIIYLYFLHKRSLKEFKAVKYLYESLENLIISKSTDNFESCLENSQLLSKKIDTIKDSCEAIELGIAYLKELSEPIRPKTIENDEETYVIKHPILGIELVKTKKKKVKDASGTGTEEKV